MFSQIVTGAGPRLTDLCGRRPMSAIMARSGGGVSQNSKAAALQTAALPGPTDSGLRRERSGIDHAKSITIGGSRPYAAQEMFLRIIDTQNTRQATAGRTHTKHN